MQLGHTRGSDDYRIPGVDVELAVVSCPSQSCSMATDAVCGDDFDDTIGGSDDVVLQVPA